MQGKHQVTYIAYKCVTCANHSNLHNQQRETSVLGQYAHLWSDQNTEPKHSRGHQVQPTYLTQLIVCIVPPSLQTIPPCAKSHLFAPASYAAV